MSKTKEKKPKQKLVPSTVRFTPEGWNAITTVGEKYDKRPAEVVRYATANRLDTFFKKHERFMSKYDIQTARDLADCVGRCCTELEKIRLELNRIGVNYNQIVRLGNKGFVPSEESEKEAFDNLYEVLVCFVNEVDKFYDELNVI